MAAATARSFFALWPTPAARDVLAKWAHETQRECGGRATPAEKIHLTLAFLGDVERTRIEGLQAAAQGLAGERFAFTLDQVGYWRHNRIIWAGTTNVPPALIALVSTLEGRLKTLGYPGEERPYAAHITLLRNARRAAPSGPPPVQWAVDEFTLVESKPAERGTRYVIVGRWPLG